jgi:hypothetical protein
LHSKTRKRHLFLRQEVEAGLLSWSYIPAKDEYRRGDGTTLSGWRSVASFSSRYSVCLITWALC